MSGGLQACITAKRPARLALSVLHAVARNEYAYSATEAELAAAWRVGPVLVQLYGVHDLIGGVAAALGTNDSNPVTCRNQRSALEPYPPVERYREVLDDDQDPALHLYRST